MEKNESLYDILTNFHRRHDYGKERKQQCSVNKCIFGVVSVDRLAHVLTNVWECRDSAEFLHKKMESACSVAGIHVVDKQPAK